MAMAPMRGTAMMMTRTTTMVAAAAMMLLTMIHGFANMMMPATRDNNYGGEADTATKDYDCDGGAAAMSAATMATVMGDVGIVHGCGAN